MYILSIAIFGFIHMMLAFADTPPACLLGAVGAQPNPADVRLLCGKLQQVVSSDIKERCSGNGEPSKAMSFYAATCLSEASIKVDVNNNAEPMVYPTASIGAHISQTAYHAPTPSADEPKESSVSQSSSSLAISPTSNADYNHPLTMVNILCTGIIVIFMF